MVIPVLYFKKNKVRFPLFVNKKAAIRIVDLLKNL